MAMVCKMKFTFSFVSFFFPLCADKLLNYDWCPKNILFSLSVFYNLTYIYVDLYDCSSMSITMFGLMSQICWKKNYHDNITMSKKILKLRIVMKINKIHGAIWHTSSIVANN